MGILSVKENCIMVMTMTRNGSEERMKKGQQEQGVQREARASMRERNRVFLHLASLPPHALSSIHSLSQPSDQLLLREPL